MEPEDIPDCFESVEQFEQWREAMIETNGEAAADAPAAFCRDCNPAFQADMKEAGRCRFPEVVFSFVFDEDCEVSLEGGLPG